MLLNYSFILNSNSGKGVEMMNMRWQYAGVLSLPEKDKSVIFINGFPIVCVVCCQSIFNGRFIDINCFPRILLSGSGTCIWLDIILSSLVELRRRIANIHQTGTSLKKVCYIMLVKIMVERVLIYSLNFFFFLHSFIVNPFS